MNLSGYVRIPSILREMCVTSWQDTGVRNPGANRSNRKPEPGHNRLLAVSLENDILKPVPVVSSNMPQLQTRGRDLLLCRKCGSTFPEGQATRDGWHYECPTEGCDSEGLGEGLRRVRS